MKFGRDSPCFHVSVIPFIPRILCSVIIILQLLSLLPPSVLAGYEDVPSVDDAEARAVYSSPEEGGCEEIQTDDELTVIPVTIVPEPGETEEPVESRDSSDYMDPKPDDKRAASDDSVTGAADSVKTEKNTDSSRNVVSSSAPAEPSVKSAASGSIPNRSYDRDRISVSIPNADDQIALVLVRISDFSGALIEELSLNAANSWTAVYDPGDYSEVIVSVSGVYDHDGGDLTELYLTQIVSEEAVVSTLPAQQQFIQKSTLESGIYVFQLENADESILISTNTTRKKSIPNYFYYYPLIPVSTLPDYSDSSSRWAVNPYASGFTVASMNNTGYLSAGVSSNKPIYVAMENAEAFSLFSDGRFSAYYEANTLCWLGYSGGSFYAAQDSSSAVRIIPWRLENVTFRIIEHPYSITLTALPQTVSVTVRLRVEGNIADRGLSFSFASSVGTPRTFSLCHLQEQEMKDISKGADFLLQFDPQSYEVTASAGELTENSVLTLNHITENTDLNLVFTKQGSIETGLSMDEQPFILLLSACTVIFVGHILFKRLTGGK